MEGKDTFKLFPRDEFFRFADETIKGLVVLGGGQDNGLLGFYQIVENGSYKLYLTFDGPAGYH